MASNANYDRLLELKSFDATQAGVKGLVDSGITNVPRIFHHPPSIHAIPVAGPTAHPIPVIDLTWDRSKAVDCVRRSSEEWGFFQVVGHGVPREIAAEMVEGVRRFNEGSMDEKKRMYSRESGRKVKFNSNFDLYRSNAAGWRDTLVCSMAPEPPAPEEIPQSCREILIDYSTHMTKLGEALSELLSEALGLHPTYLKDAEYCCKGHNIGCHYYPPCPEPNITLGINQHSDPGFLTVLLQDKLGGLQVLHQGQWVDVPPLDDAFVVNIGDLLQLMSNDKFTSVEHRVVANRHGSRISVACIFTSHFSKLSTRLCKPIEELLSEDKPPLYKQVLISDYHAYFYERGLNGKMALSHFRLDDK